MSSRLNMAHSADMSALLLCAVLIAFNSGDVVRGASPVVVGFDRFARHGEMSQRAGGELLIAELGCTACHQTDRERLAPKRGPILSGAGNRLNAAWLQQFLASPQRTKPGTTMPDVLAAVPADERPSAITALVAFIGDQHMPFPEVKAGGASPVRHRFWQRGDSQRGRELYHQIGCVACHAPDQDYAVSGKVSEVNRLLSQLDPEEIEELGLSASMRSVPSVPHPKLGDKYSAQSLTFFLMRPQSIRSSDRMPDFRLLPDEAADIAAYLIDGNATSPSRTPAETSPQLIERGRQLFADLQCVNCHEIKGLKPSTNSIPFAKVDFNASLTCVGEATSALPHYELDASQLIAIRDATLPKPDQDVGDDAAWQLTQLNCYACHARRELGGVGPTRQPYFETLGQADLGDEGRLPPPLTHVGDKLHQKWLAQMILGKGSVRPYLAARMPSFSKSTSETLSSLLVTADRVAPGKPAASAKPATASQLVDAGRSLMDNGCVQCHPLKGENLPGVVGIDLASSAKRIRPEWFRRFLFNPVDLKSRTRMPTFFPDGVSSSPKILDGNVDQQIEAIWTYLNDIDHQPLPTKVLDARNQNYELIPDQSPVLLRTFMKSAGTHAIAVGFPQRVHFAFDSRQVRLAQVWRGRFIDAYATWFVRFVPKTEPLGDDIIEMPAGVPFATLDDSSEPWPQSIDYEFRGYAIDSAGVPTFRYRFGDYEIDDRIQPNESSGLKRQWDIRPAPRDRNPTKLFLRSNVGATLRAEGAKSHTNNDGLKSAVVGQVGDGVIRTANGISDVVFPIRLDGPATVSVEYSWPEHDQ